MYGLHRVPFRILAAPAGNLTSFLAPQLARLIAHPQRQVRRCYQSLLVGTCHY
jgi:hypothetical protein